MSIADDVTIRPAQENELQALYQWVTADEQWTRFNGPYFPYATPTLAQFEQNTFARLRAGDDMQLIIYAGKPVGSVGYYWECESTRWLEMGVIIYDARYWGKGIAQRALTQWIQRLFAKLEIQRVGLTTWSGNPRMMACAEKLGLQQEARLRKVRYYQGQYYDSLKYGLLRSEWRQGTMCSTDCA